MDIIDIIKEDIKWLEEDMTWLPKKWQRDRQDQILDLKEELEVLEDMDMGLLASVEHVETF